MIIVADSFVISVNIETTARRDTSDGDKSYTAGDPVDLWMSTIPYVTLPSDTPASQSHFCGLTDAPNTIVKAWSTPLGFPEIGGVASGEPGVIEWNNPRVQFLRDLYTDGATVIVKRIEITNVAGTPTPEPYATAETIGIFEVRGRAAIEGQTARFALVDSEQGKLNRPLVRPRFQGLGPELQFDGVDDTATAPMASWGHSATQAWTAQFRLYPTSTLPGAASEVQALFIMPASSARSAMCYANADHKIIFRCDTVTTGSNQLVDTTAVTAHNPVWITVSHNGAGRLRMTIVERDGVYRHQESELSPTENGKAAIGNLEYMHNSAGGYFTAGAISHFRYWASERSESQAIDTSNRLLTQTEIESLAFYQPFSDGYGTGAADLGPQGADATISGAVWRMSSEGNPGLRDYPMGLLLGERRGFAPVHLGVTEGGAAFQAGPRESLDRWRYVTSSAVPLVPAESLSLNVTWNGAKVQAYSWTGPDPFERLFPGVSVDLTCDSDPARDGTYTVVLVDPDGQWFTTDPVATGGPQINTAFTLQTNNAEWDEDDERPGTILIDSSVDPGKVRCWARGVSVGASYDSGIEAVLLELMEEWAGLTGYTAEDLSAISARSVGVWVGTDDPPINDILKPLIEPNRIAVYAEAGGIVARRISTTLGAFTPQDIVIPKSWVENITAEVLSSPPERLMVVYDVVDPLDYSDIAALAPDDWRARLAEPGKIEMQDVVSLADWPNAPNPEAIVTALIDPDDATTIAAALDSDAVSVLWRVDVTEPDAFAQAWELGWHVVAYGPALSASGIAAELDGWETGGSGVLVGFERDPLANRVTLWLLRSDTAPTVVGTSPPSPI